MGIFNWINGQAGGTPLSAENLNQMQINLLEMIFPVGSTYITQSANTNPNSVLGIGTWQRFNGLIALGVDENDENLNIIGSTGGEKTHTLTISEMPSHQHKDAIDVGGSQTLETVQYLGSKSNAQYYVSTSAVGGGQPHNNMQPYEVVGYMWIRRA